MGLYRGQLMSNPLKVPKHENFGLGLFSNTTFFSKVVYTLGFMAQKLHRCTISLRLKRYLFWSNAKNENSFEGSLGPF